MAEKRGRDPSYRTDWWLTPSPPRHGGRASISLRALTLPKGPLPQGERARVDARGALSAGGAKSLLRSQALEYTAENEFSPHCG